MADKSGATAAPRPDTMWHFAQPPSPKKNARPASRSPGTLTSAAEELSDMIIATSPSSVEAGKSNAGIPAEGTPR